MENVGAPTLKVLLEVRWKEFCDRFLRKDVGVSKRRALQTQLSAGIATRVKRCNDKRGTK